MLNAERPIYIVALGDSFQGFHTPDIEYEEGTLPVLPAFGTEEAARTAVAGLSRVSGVTRPAFRICKYTLADVMEG